MTFTSNPPPTIPITRISFKKSNSQEFLERQTPSSVFIPSHPYCLRKHPISKDFCLLYFILGGTYGSTERKMITSDLFIAYSDQVVFFISYTSCILLAFLFLMTPTFIVFLPMTRNLDRLNCTRMDIKNIMQCLSYIQWSIEFGLNKCTAL